MHDARQTTEKAAGQGHASAPMARWLAVLEAFARQPEWGVRDLAEATGISRSAVHRIVRDMAALGLLAPAAIDGRAQIGPALARLAIDLADRIDIVRVARPVLEELRDETGETSILTLYDRGRRRFRAVIAAESSHPIRYIWESLQDWNDLHRGASGKGILAFLPLEEQAAVLASNVGGPGGPSATDLRAELDRCREVGWVVSRGERFPGAVGVAAPIRDRIARVVGSVLLGWPDNRTDEAKELAVAAAARRAADRISTALGYRMDPEGRAAGERR